MFDCHLPCFIPFQSSVCHPTIIHESKLLCFTSFLCSFRCNLLSFCCTIALQIWPRAEFRRKKIAIIPSKNGGKITQFLAIKFQFKKCKLFYSFPLVVSAGSHVKLWECCRDSRKRGIKTLKPTDIHPSQVICCKVSGIIRWCLSPTTRVVSVLCCFFFVADYSRGDNEGSRFWEAFIIQ